MTTWHSDERLLARYHAGSIDPARAASIEAHLTACEDCRRVFSTLADDEAATQASWHGIVDVLDRPRVGLVERALLRLRVPPHWARLVAATPALRMSWLLSVTAIIGLSIIVAREGSGDPSLFLVVAPLLPLVGIATAFGPFVDPCYELGVAAPVDGFRLLLIRSAAVVGTCVPLLALASASLPSVDVSSAAWLLPTAALVSCSLALSTRVAPAFASTGLVVAWVGVVGWSSWGHSGTTFAARCAAFSASGQWTALLIAAIAATVTVTQSKVLDRTAYLS